MASKSSANPSKKRTRSSNPNQKFSQTDDVAESHVASSCYETANEKEEDEVVKKFRQFKKFDIVDGSSSSESDHHFADGGSKWKKRKIEGTSLVSSAPTSWSKRILSEWRILERNLPDSISVRVYEERIDLLRAVIVGASGTPYHDGLFFFDVFFPSDYPSKPPNVYYHSHGERLNPNLYSSGYVCLSLLNTWNGSKNEKWVPDKSTMLQVLLSIQALVLNAYPFFNEPFTGNWAGHNTSELIAQTYNERVFIKSCKTMLNILNRPPKHFEDFVVGHFRERALVILAACKAYSEGVQVGCLTEDGVLNVDRDRASARRTPKELHTIEVYYLWFWSLLLEWKRPKGTREFKMQLNSMTQSFVKAFTQIGVEDCEKFLLQSSEQGNTKCAPKSKLRYLAGSAAIFAAVCLASFKLK